MVVAVAVLACAEAIPVTSRLEVQMVQAESDIGVRRESGSDFVSLLHFGGTLEQVYINILVLFGFGIVFALVAVLRINVRDA